MSEDKLLGSVIGGIGRGLEHVDIVAIVHRGNCHWLEGMKVYLVDLLQMARMHEAFFALGEVP